MVVSNDLTNIKFSNKPSIKEIIAYIAKNNLELFDNDREFCYIFDKIALNNGYNEMSLPPLWSIGREIFRYKKEHNLSAKEKSNQISLLIHLPNNVKYNIRVCDVDKKPTTKQIIEAMWNNYPEAFNNDRLLVTIFDCLAIYNGIQGNELPKYWNIIRAVFDYKKDKDNIPIKNSSEKIVQKEISKGIPIDYRVLNIALEELNIEPKLANKLKTLGISKIGDFLNISSDFWLVNRLNGFKKYDVNKALEEYGINLDNKYEPVVITMPSNFYKKLNEVFNSEIVQILDKFAIRNIGILASKFPDIMINDEALMETPKVFEYIDTITTTLKNIGICELPIKLSKFQIEDLNQLSLEELLTKNYLKEIIDAINSEISMLKDFSQEVIINRFGINGNYKKTLEEIGKEHNVTRERIRQIENKSLRNIGEGIDKLIVKLDTELKKIFAAKIPCLLIDKSLNYSNYKEIIQELLSQKNINFDIDFNVGLIKEKNIRIEDLLENETVSEEIKERIESFIYKDYIKINNQMIKNDKFEILIYFLQTHCRTSICFDDFQYSYKTFLSNNGLSHREDLIYFDNTLYNKLSSLDCILLSPGKIIRYYDIEIAQKLVKNIDLTCYQDMEISAKKIFNDNIELMEEFEVKNEYELHNLLKKHVKNQNIDFSRMPTIKLGICNRNQQVLDLLKQLAPISNTDLAKAYSEEYGVDEKSILANYFDCINHYYSNGYYNIETDIIANNKLLKLKQLLKKDFYWKDEVLDICKNEFDNFAINNLNVISMNKINYLVASTCIYSDKFSSLANYIKTFLSQDIINMNINYRLRSLHTFYIYFIEMKNNLDLIEFASNMYININKLVSVGISKDILYNYQDKVKEFVGDDYFTIYSLRRNGFSYQKLDNLGFEDYFYSSILIKDNEIMFKKIANTYLMKKDNKPFELEDFIIYIMGKLRKIDIYDLCDFIRDYYGLEINKYKIIAITKISDLYYNRITEKIYIDYDEFYNEI